MFTTGKLHLLNVVLGTIQKYHNYKLNEYLIYVLCSLPLRIYLLLYVMFAPCDYNFSKLLLLFKYDIYKGYST